MAGNDPESVSRELPTLVSGPETANAILLELQLLNKNIPPSRAALTLGGEGGMF